MRKIFSVHHLKVVSFNNDQNSVLKNKNTISLIRAVDVFWG